MSTTITLPDSATLYVAGAMSGIPQYNVPAFMAAAGELRSRGYRVLLPADLMNTRLRKRLLASKDGKDDPTGKSWGDWLNLDISLVTDDADAVVVLPGWRGSRGARLETFTAYLCAKPVVYYPTLHRVPNTALFSAWTGRRGGGRWAIVPAAAIHDPDGD